MKFLTLALAFSAVPALAHAHPGPHDDIATFSDMAGHILGSPDHASWLILAATAVLSMLAVKAAVRIVTGENLDKKH